MKTVYIAEDGTEFETESKCRKYEEKLVTFLHELHNGIHAFDDDGDIIDFNDYDIDCLEEAFQDISYIKFDSKKAIEVFAEKANDFGLCDIEHDIHRPLEVGERYFYDWYKDKWVCLEDKQREITEIANIFSEDNYD